jgi:hypothetical protein
LQAEPLVYKFVENEGMALYGKNNRDIPCRPHQYTFHKEQGVIILPDSSPDFLRLKYKNQAVHHFGVVS